ncbi:hypothetical protein HYX14_03930 [Candidatus Woesearchaeota archaeon]|nr:hypothetical protein [Candidatus Woesearchaeota archaeon]
MKKMLLLLLLLVGLLVVPAGCQEEIPTPVQTTLVTEPVPISEAQILTQYPDGLDEALKELEQLG